MVCRGFDVLKAVLGELCVTEGIIGTEMSEVSPNLKKN